jgi:hypothetical protein
MAEHLERTLLRAEGVGDDANGECEREVAHAAS